MSLLTSQEYLEPKFCYIMNGNDVLCYPVKFLWSNVDKNENGVDEGYKMLYYWLWTEFLRLKGTNSLQKTYEIFHVYCIFYSGFMNQTTVIFGITKDGSLVLNTLASWNSFTCRNLFQNYANDMSEYLTCETAFCKKSSKFCIVLIIRFWSNFASLW